VWLVCEQVTDVVAVERVHGLEPDGVDDRERSRDDKEMQYDHKGA
jgi:hypothetical protein